MQFLSALRRAPARPDFAQEVSAGSRLPYAAHLDDRVIGLRDGSLMLVIAMDGWCAETAETDEINYRKGLREAMLRAIGSSRFALYHHIVRRRVTPVIDGVFADAFSARLDAAWAARLAQRQLFANDLYITLIRRPDGAGGGVRGRLAGWLAGLLGGRFDAGGAPQAALVGEMRALVAAGEQLVAAMAAYGARIACVYDTEHGACSGPLEFLSALFNGEQRPVSLPHGDVGEYLPYRRVSFGQDTIEWGEGARGAVDFGAVLSVKDYPGQTVPGMLDDLLRLPCEMVIAQSFAFVDRAESLSRMNLALRRMQASDDEALSLRADLAQAKDDVAGARAAMGEHHLTVLLRADDQAALDANTAQARAAMADLGIVAVREDVGLEAAFWAQFPGNFAYIARGALVGSANFASLASGHNFPVGRAGGNHWGDAVTLFETSAAGPYHFNFHHGDLGNFTVIGPSGSGKTVIVNFLLAQARRFGPRIAFFDKDRGAELFIRAIGGAYTALRPGAPSGLNPLAMADSPENRRFLIDWVGQLAGGVAGPEEAARIAEAVAANFTAPASLRRLSAFVELLRGGERPTPNDLHARLRAWVGAGEHAWLFDNASDMLDISRDTLGFDMTRLLDDPLLRTPAMMYLFHRVDERLDGHPSIIVVDEGWKALDDDVFAARIRDWEKTIRKRGGIVGFVTQNAEDALASRIAGAIVEQTATQIFTPNPQARADDYIGGFGLTAHEFALVRALPDHAHCFLVKQGHDSVVLRLDLLGEGDLLTVLSGRESSVRLLDAIRAADGDDPAVWLPRLLEVA